MTVSVDLSIILPVINEKDRINTAIERIFEQAFHGSIQIIVVDGDPGGSTIQAVTDERVICLTGLPGRGIQMNAGAAAARGSLLLFLHCDTVLPPNGLNKIAGMMNEPSFDAGAFDLKIAGKKFVYRIIERSASLRSRLTRIPYGDQAIFIRRDYFFLIGQYAQIPIMEDVDLMQRIKKKKGKTGFIDASVLTSARRWEKEGLLFCTLRNWFLVILYLCGVAPVRLVRLYKHH